jgi:hypothetical protein
MHAAALALKAIAGPAYIRCVPLGKDKTMLGWDCGWGYAGGLDYHVIFTSLNKLAWLVKVITWD